MVKYMMLIETLPVLGLKSRDSIYRRMMKMVKCGVLEHETIKRNGTFSFFRFGKAMPELLWSGGAESHPEGYGLKVARGTDEKSEQKTLLTDDYSIREKTAVPSIAERDAEFLAQLNNMLGKKFRVMPTKASRQLTSRIKEGYTVDEILKAAKACSQTDHHRKNKQHLTPEFITRGDKLQVYAEMEAVADNWVQDRVNGRGVENMRGEGVDVNGKTNQQWKEERNVSTK